MPDYSNRFYFAFFVAGPTINMGYNAPDPNALLNVINQITDPA
jgi:hypothetical protein